MYGLYGILSFQQEEKEQLRERIEKMARTVCADGVRIQRLFLNDKSAMFVLNSDKMQEIKSYYENENVVVIFWGYLWNKNEVKSKINANNNSNNATISEIIALFIIRFDPADIYQFNGRFVIAVWKKTEQELMLVNDRYGFCPLYYWNAKNQFVFGSQYKAISAEKDFPKEIDWSALGDFLSLGYSTGERTLFKHIRLLPPASIATIRRGGELTIRRYWDYSFHTEEDPVRTAKEYEKGFYSYLSEALERQIETANRILIPVSGGYDSRILSGLLSKRKEKEKIIALSYGHEDALDVVYGKKIAKKSGFTHYSVPIKTDYLKEFADDFVWMLEGTVNCLNAHMLTTFEIMEKEHIDSVMTGFFGDILAGSGTWIYSLGVLGGTNDEKIFGEQYGVHCDIMKDEDIQKYVRRELQGKMLHSAKNALWDRYLQSTTKNRYFKSRYFSIHERQRRYTSFNLYVFDHKNVLAPFLDHEFVNYVLHIPSTLLIHQNLYSNVIANYLPALARVPYNETRLPIQASKWRRGLQWRWEKWNKHKCVQATLGRNWKKRNDNYIRSADAIRNGSKEFVVDHIKSCPMVHDVFNKTEIDHMIQNHLSGKSNEPLKILALLTLALWHKHFH